MALGPIDTHVHLTDLTNQAKSIENAKNNSLSGIIAVSTKIESFFITIDFAESHRGFIYAALGIHPTEFIDQKIEEASKVIMSNSGKIKAIGEIGLDYWFKPVRKDKVMKEQQREFYKTQLQIATELDLPVIIHSRGAWEDCISLAREQKCSSGVFHWYSGPTDVLTEIIESGFYVSCTPAIEYSPELRMAMKAAPIERILVETDSPVWIKTLNRPAEPADVNLAVTHLAALKELTIDEVVRETNRNARELFRI